MTPKKFLRVETARTDELVQGEFRHIIDDPHVQEPKKVAKVVYCSGKFYHELLERREALKKTDLAIVRVEQLYPLHAEMVRTIDGRYPKGAPRVWAQEESRNAGAFLYAMDAFRERAGIELSYSGRPASATPATGSEHAHKKQQEKILSAVVGPLGGAGEPVKGHPQGENGSPATQAPEPAKQGKSHAKVGR
jgi:2-oxoglutarate dehydrogenase E1 component